MSELTKAQALKPMIVYVQRRRSRDTGTEYRSGSNSGSGIQTPNRKPRPQHPFHDIDVDVYINGDTGATRIEHDFIQEENTVVDPPGKPSMRVSISRINPLKLLRPTSWSSSSRVIKE